MCLWTDIKMELSDVKNYLIACNQILSEEKRKNFKRLGKKISFARDYFLSHGRSVPV